MADLKEAADFVASVSRAANELPLPYYFGLHIGPPGSGKTHILKTMPGKTIVLDCRDGGTGTAPLVSEGGRITVVPITTWEELQKAFIFLKGGEHDFDSVGLDGLSKLQNYDLQYIIANTQRKDGTKAVKMEKDMWGVAHDHMANLINGLEGIGLNRHMHVAITAWEKELGGDDASSSDLIPDLQGGIKGRIGGMVDICTYHVTRDVPTDQEGPGDLEFRCLTQPYLDRKMAKCRWKRLDDEGNEQKALDPLEVPNIGEWIEKIRAGVEQMAEVKTPGAVPSPSSSGPSPTPENAAAAAELAASIDNGLPDHDTLKATVTEWFTTACAQYPDKQEGIVELIKQLSKEFAVAKLGEATPAQLAKAIEVMMKYETEELAPN